MLKDEPHNSEITLHALSSWVAPKKRHVVATISVHMLITLIYNGSTHNFINQHMAKVL